MNLPDILIYTYSALKNRKGLHPYFLTPFRRLVRVLSQYLIPKWFEHVEICESRKISDVVFSLTSFPARIKNVHLVIHCLLRQTVCPKKIVLWLSKEQFKDIELPEKLSKLQNDVFEIKYVDGDIKSHKKYLYVLREYGVYPIFLVDDDLYYPSDMLEKCLKASLENPNSIICRYGNIVKYDEDNNILPYNHWFSWRSIVYGNSNDPNFFFGTGGGVLLRKEMLYNDVTNIKLATELAPLADDVWINAMANLNGASKIKIQFGELLEVKTGKSPTLSSMNVQESMNDTQINNVIQYYKKKGLEPFKKRS